MNIIWKGSPNYIKRTKPIRKIVAHWFGTGTLESANSRFQNPFSKVSAHYGISRGRVWQWVEESNVAFHAGNLSVNAESVGIEHDATLNGHDLSEQDYNLSAQLISKICKKYNIPLDRKHIIRHGEVKPTQCPGTINLDKIINLAKGTMAQIRTQAKGPSRRIVLEAGDENEWKVLTKIYGKDPNVVDEVIT